ncbi:MAG: dTDP-4-dehydrorhamnose reductase [Nitrospirae bacterium RBG_16_43_11]|nr:MAG: dTDP-4-dehydrorhamnose reductase [Nitrospirae bacterium RBG_16_43_11]
MKIMILGAGGQLGSELVNILQDDTLIPLTHMDIEMTDEQQVNSILSSNMPDVVINTAAYHRVDDCEDNVELSFAVNSYAVRTIARICNDLGITFVHFSTDYVFGGEKKTPYVEDDCPNPHSVYAVSKLAGELFVRNICSRYYLIRTCGLYGAKGVSGKGGNFIETMIRLANGKKPLNVVSDQIVTPTYAKELAAKVSQLIRTEEYGSYHITNNGGCSWYEFARTIFELTGIDADISPISSSEFGAKARRPAYSVLENRNLKLLGLDDMMQWHDALKEYLIEKGHVR